MESIKKLRKICQPEFEEVKENKVHRVYKRFFRLFSIYFTKALLYINFPAGAASLLAFISGLISSILFYYGKFLLGALILQLWYLFDTIDGELARYYYNKKNKKGYLERGEYLDLIQHHLIHSFILLGLGFGTYKLSNNISYLYLGLSSTFSLLMNELIDLNKIKVLFYYYKDKNIKNLKKDSKHIMRKLFIIFTYPFISNLILIAALLNIIKLLIIFYGLIFPIYLIFKIIKNINLKWE